MANDVSGPKDWRTGHHKTCSASLRSCPGPPEWGRYGGPSPAALGQRRSRRPQPLPRHANFKQSLGRRGSLGEEESLGLHSPSRSHRLIHKHTHARHPRARPRHRTDFPTRNTRAPLGQLSSVFPLPQSYSCVLSYPSLLGFQDPQSSAALAP